MTLITRATWALLLTLTFATVLLVPRQVEYTFPAESTCQFIITETGVSPSELLELSEQHDVEFVQLLMTTDTMGLNSEPLATNVIEILGHDPDDYIRPPLTPMFAEAPIVYAGSHAQDSALGAWHVIGREANVYHALDAVQAQWSHAIQSSRVLVPGTATEMMLHAPLGRALLLALATHAVVTASAVLTRPAPWRSSLLSGRSRARLLIHLMRLGLVSVSTWVLIPLGALGLAIVYDVYANALLSVHRLMTELIVVAALAALSATAVGITIGWGVLARTSRGRGAGSSALAPRVRTVLGALLCVVAVSMTWSFASSSSTAVTGILQDQSLRRQAQAQNSLPAAYSLSIRTASEPTYDSLMPRIGAFVNDLETSGSLVLAWAIPDGTTPDASGPPTLYLNNAAATHYGLGTVSPTEMALYRPRQDADDDANLSSQLSRNAAFEAQLGGSVATPTVSIHDLEQTTAHLPQSLPEISFFLGATATTTSDCLIVVVPDGYFAPTNYLSALSQGAALVTADTQEELLNDLSAHRLAGLVARVDAVGGGHTATIGLSTHRFVLDVLVLAASGAAAVVSTSVATRSWVQVHRRQQQIGRLFGGRTGLMVRLVPLVLVLIELVVLALHSLLTPDAPVAITHAVCATALTAAAVIAYRQATGHHLTRTRHD
ncbi:MULTISPECIES: hypothetical protein [Actinomyces]|uniref:Uncharacterized protein n=1 Tax=Actinomyces respiraculi TaxID=2744574 RepID=A0A7T0PUW5_9ACTO|nr:MULTISPECIES: hypothetical protein [Actinomyces]QPL04626.1 hypothetical protein ID810_07420 [Actinomyces respiraculi]